MSLIVEKRGAVGWIVFNQPAKRNAINGAMWRGIPQAMAQYDADPEVRCVAFRGAGTEAFASGADISEFDEIRAQVPGRRVRRPARPGAAFDPDSQAIGGGDLRLLHGRWPEVGLPATCATAAARRSSASRRQARARLASKGTSA
jgi:enoyl-CoA hydratase/carnithine racemase